MVLYFTQRRTIGTCLRKEETQEKSLGFWFGFGINKALVYSPLPTATSYINRKFKSLQSSVNLTHLPCPPGATAAAVQPRHQANHR